MNSTPHQTLKQGHNINNFNNKNDTTQTTNPISVRRRQSSGSFQFVNSNLPPSLSNNPLKKESKTTVQQEKFINDLSNRMHLDIPSVDVSKTSRMSVSTDISTPKPRNGFYKIKNLIKEEELPFELELKHELATTTLLRKLVSKNENYSDLLENELDEENKLEDLQNLNTTESEHINSPMLLNDEDITNIHFGNGNADNNLDYEKVFLPLPRINPIPKDQLNNPANYISNSSKLNPENNFIYNANRDILSSPSSSPSTGPISPTHQANLSHERRSQQQKRRMSAEDLPIPPPSAYKRQKVHRLNSSPRTRPTSTPSPTTLHHFPNIILPFNRKRSGSVSSIGSSIGSSRDVAMQLADNDYNSNTTESPRQILPLYIRHHQGQQLQLPHQNLNLTAAQGDFNKMSLSE
ncbi:hypothetical protein HK099_008387 [Clydaea vesicula]|uniref:Uncharacterized protein n=1 Tax=Clydaea vesicula TaxID=447962 RepID=A0AAD5XWX9_9FUNG|nr:hypothetical protein HK099_008387 [Clydaea vesicula]